MKFISLRATWFTCHMVSHSVACQPTQVNTLHLNPSHAEASTQFNYHGWMEG